LLYYGRAVIFALPYLDIARMIYRSDFDEIKD